MSPHLMQLGFALSGVGKSDHHDVKSQDKHTQKIQGFLRYVTRQICNFLAFAFLIFILLFPLLKSM